MSKCGSLLTSICEWLNLKNLGNEKNMSELLKINKTSRKTEQMYFEIGSRID